MIARDLAARFVVMLKNEGVLPLKTGSKIAVVGGACDAYHDAETLMKRWDLGDYYVVGGSGRVVAARIHESVLDALTGCRYCWGRGRRPRRSSQCVSRRRRNCSVRRSGDDGGRRPRLAAARQPRLFDRAVAGVEDTPVVLVALAPGAIVLPQADAAAAALVCFLCGEATGLAIADVLLGRKEPGGRLPVTIPRTEARRYSRARTTPVHTRRRARRLPRH